MSANALSHGLLGLGGGFSQELLSPMDDHGGSQSQSILPAPAVDVNNNAASALRMNGGGDARQVPSLGASAPATLEVGGVGAMSSQGTASTAPSTALLYPSQTGGSLSQPFYVASQSQDHLLRSLTPGGGGAFAPYSASNNNSRVVPTLVTRQAAVAPGGGGGAKSSKKTAASSTGGQATQTVLKEVRSLGVRQEKTVATLQELATFLYRGRLQQAAESEAAAELMRRLTARLEGALGEASALAEAAAREWRGGLADGLTAVVMAMEECRAFSIETEKKRAEEARKAKEVAEERESRLAEAVEEVRRLVLKGSDVRSASELAALRKMDQVLEGQAAALRELGEMKDKERAREEDAKPVLASAATQTEEGDFPDVPNGVERSRSVVVGTVTEAAAAAAAEDHTFWRGNFRTSTPRPPSKWLPPDRSSQDSISASSPPRLEFPSPRAAYSPHEKPQSASSLQEQPPMTTPRHRRGFFDSVLGRSGSRIRDSQRKNPQDFNSSSAMDTTRLPGPPEAPSTLASRSGMRQRRSLAVDSSTDEDDDVAFMKF